MGRGRTQVALPWVVVSGWALTLTAILLWPLTRAGYPLAHDMVFSAQQPLNLASIGVTSAPPRAVPVDAVVALLEHVVGGSVVSRLALALPLLAAGIGTATLLAEATLAARLACCAIAIWNPYVVERLAIGQWALLWAYAALPWLVWAITRLPGAAGWSGRTLALAAASLTPTGGLVAAVTAVAVAAGVRRPRREVLATAGIAVLLQLPWIVPAVTSPASPTSDPAAVRAFAARAEHVGGAVTTLLGGGGIWDADVVPASRAQWPAWLGLAVLVLAAVVGARRLVTQLGRPLVITLTALGVEGLVVAAAASLPGGAALIEDLVRAVPGAGLLRDAQKWVMPLVLLESLLVGAAVEAIIRRAEQRAEHDRRLVGIAPVVLVAALVLPVLALPDAAASLRTVLRPVRYPADWSVARRLVRDGDAVTVPFGSYRLVPWAPGRSVSDPAPALLSVPVVTDDRLAVSGRLLAGEDPRAARVGAALAAPDVAGGLAAEGVRWVIVERGTPGPLPPLSGLQAVFNGADVAVYRVPGDVASSRPSAPRVAGTVAADVLALLAVAAAIVGPAMARRRRFAVARSAAQPGRQLGT